MLPTKDERSGTRLSIVVAAYNEAPRLEKTLPLLSDYLRALGGKNELIVVDDGSVDETASLLAGATEDALVVVRHERNLGKGAAVKTEILASHGDWILLTDVDLSTPIEELSRLLAHRDQAPVVVGSRAIEGSRIDPRQPFYRELLGKTYNVFLRLLGLTRLRDTQCGFKLIRGELARDVAHRMQITGFAFDVELLWLCEAAGASILETAVAWGHCAPSSVLLPKEPLHMLRDAIGLRWRISRSSGSEDRGVRQDAGA